MVTYIVIFILVLACINALALMELTKRSKLHCMLLGIILVPSVSFRIFIFLQEKIANVVERLSLILGGTDHDSLKRESLEKKLEKMVYKPRGDASKKDDSEKEQ